MLPLCSRTPGAATVLVNELDASGFSAFCSATTVDLCAATRPLCMRSSHAIRDRKAVAGYAVRAAVLIAWPGIHHLEGFARWRLRRRTPGPPLFPSMNSTPADSRARRTAKSFAAVIEVSSSASSARRIVVTPTADFARDLSQSTEGEHEQPEFGR